MDTDFLKNKFLIFERRMERFFLAPLYVSWKALLISLCGTILILIALQYLIVLLGSSGQLPDILTRKIFFGYPLGSSETITAIGTPIRDFRISFVDEVIIFYFLTCAFLSAFSKKDVAEKKYRKILILLLCYSFLILPYLRNRKLIYSSFNIDHIKMLESICVGNVLSCDPKSDSSKEFIN